jgi:hypothetical protein
MSTRISKKRFVELLRTLIKKEIDEASTTATAGGAYDTPRAFSGKGKDRRKSIASGSGFEKVNELNQSITGNKMFMKRTILPITKKAGIKRVKIKILPPQLPDDKDKIELSFDADKGTNDKLLDLLKQKIGKKGSMKRKKLNVTIQKESGIMYRAGVKKYGKEGMTKIQQAAGRKASHAEIGKIKDKYDKTREIPEFVKEDTKDIAKAKKLSQKLQGIEGKYRKVMYDLSDRLQADDKNHKLQDELIKSYTKNVTSFMRDMIKITKRVK